MDDKKLDEATLRAVMKHCSDEHAKCAEKFKESHDTYDVSCGMTYFDVWDWCYKQTESYKRYKQSRKGEDDGQRD